jgi:hypothetical protein
MKNLNELISVMMPVAVLGNVEQNINLLCYDSRIAKEDSLFFAIKGTMLMDMISFNQLLIMDVKQL